MSDTNADQSKIQPNILQIRANALIGPTLKRIGVMQDKGYLGQDSLILQGVGAQAGRVALICGQKKGVIKILNLEPYTLPSGVITMRVTVSINTTKGENLFGKRSTPHATWKVCYPGISQSMRSSCEALRKKVAALEGQETLLLSGAGQALETMLVLQYFIIQNLSERCSIEGREVFNVVITNKETGRKNIKTVMHLWITKQNNA